MVHKGFQIAVAAAGLALLAGCRTGHPAGPRPADHPEPAPKGSQVVDVQVALARTLESRGEVRQAAHYYEKATQQDPGRADAWARLAVLADKEGRFAESGEFYRRAMGLQPTNADLACNLGYSLYLQQRWDEAEGALRRAVELNPDHQRAYNNLGLVLGRLGRGPEALECFQRAGCSKADAHTNLGYALAVNGDLGAARAQYELALRLQPSSAAARKGLANLEAVAARLDPPPAVPPSEPGVRPAAAEVLQ